MNRVLSFLISIFFIWAPTIAQVMCGSGRLSIGPQIYPCESDITINGFDEIYWLNRTNDSGPNWLRINLFNDYRTCISGGGYHVRLYNPDTKNYSIIKSEWVYTNASPPNEDPELLSASESVQLMGKIRTLKSTDKFTNYPYILDLNSIDSKENDIIQEDEYGNVLINTSSVIPIMAGALQFMKQELDTNSEKLNLIKKCIENRKSSRNGYIELNYNSEIDAITLKSRLPIRGYFYIYNTNGVIERAEAVELSDDKSEMLIDLSDIRPGSHIASIRTENDISSINFSK